MSRRIGTEARITLSENQIVDQSKGKLLFTDYKGQSCALLIRENRLLAARFFPKKKSLIGAVYIARVKNVVKNMDAYFVELGTDKREVCFLSGKDAAYPCILNRKYDGKIKEGDEILVQVIRDAQKTKQPSVTTLISLSNDYFALSVGDARIGISNKVTVPQKKALQKLVKTLNMDELSTVLKEYAVGVVVRTKATELLDDGTAFVAAFDSLKTELLTLYQSAIHKTCFSCLIEPPAAFEGTLADLVSEEEYEEILTDSASLYQKLSAEYGDRKKIRYYSEKEQAELSLASLYSLAGKLETALERRVWLKSGGYLIIDPTEALTVIDVNSGKFEASKDIEESHFLVNKEAAEEIALQLRLRNLSGIIIVDFINMREYSHQDALLKHLRALVSKDRQLTQVVDMTPLGLVEITRKKNYKPLLEQIEK